MTDATPSPAAPSDVAPAPSGVDGRPTSTSTVSTPPADASAARRATRRFVAAGVLVALLVRTVDAMESSFWLDEMHTVAHGLRPDLDAVADSVARDFHAPLFYMAVHGASRFLGGWDDVRRYRALTVPAGVLILLPVALLARRGRGRRAVELAVWLCALMPFLVYFSMELRPYAWVMLASAALAWAAFDDRGPAFLRATTFFAATALGTLSWYAFPVALIAVGVARLLGDVVERGAARETPDRRPWRPLPLWGLVVLGLLGGATLLPWISTRAEWVFTSPGELAPDAADGADATSKWFDVGPHLQKEALQQFPKLVAPRLDSLGSPWTETSKVGLALLGAAVALGSAWWLYRRFVADPRPLDPALRAVVIYAVAALAVMTALQIRQWGRFALRYNAVMAWALPLLLAEALAATSGRVGRWVRGTALVGVGLLATGEIFGAPREDTEGAVTVALETAQRLAVDDPSKPPLLTAILWQPHLYEMVLPFRCYAPHADFRSPERVPRKGDPDFDRPLVVITQRDSTLQGPNRSAPEEPRAVAIVEGRKVVWRHTLAGGVKVQVFTPAEPASQER
ncbi:MAG TPA: hypothetical protein VEI02_13570 [Planctomycetota bacterium]|nr:hypothetical protein [Planctomycetota bacterium]